MALSIKQQPFPEPDGPITVFVPVEVDGVRYAMTHGEAILLGMAELEQMAEREGVTLAGKPTFKIVQVAGSGDRFLMGEQEWK